MSEGSRISWDDLRVASLVRTVGFQAVLGSTMRLEAECLCVLASNGATSDQHPLLGKNADYVTSVSGIDDLFVMEVILNADTHTSASAFIPKKSASRGNERAGLAVVGAGQYPSDGRDAFAAKLPTARTFISSTATSFHAARRSRKRSTRCANRPWLHRRVMILADATERGRRSK
jgi:hypothetical protein